MNLYVPPPDLYNPRILSLQQSFQSRLAALYTWSNTTLWYSSSKGIYTPFRVACNITVNRKGLFTILGNHGDVKLWLKEPARLTVKDTRDIQFRNIALHIHLECPVTFTGTSGRVWDEHVKYLQSKFYVGHIIPQSSDASQGHPAIQDYDLAHHALNKEYRDR